MTELFDHHRATIERATARLQARDDVLGVLVGGSIAHGFATATSDVDLLIVVSDAEWERRLAAGDTTELDRESATYDGGYVDCKYTSVAFIRDVAARGSETTRFAFDGVTVAWSRVDGLDEAVRSAASIPDGRGSPIGSVPSMPSSSTGNGCFARASDRTTRTSGRWRRRTSSCSPAG